MKGLKHCRRSLRRVARELTRKRCPISHTTLRRRLTKLGYSLQGNRKVLAKKNSPHRSAQFNVINRLRASFKRRGWPIVSGDTKKRELIGLFKNSGRTWRKKKSPQKVSAYDFPSDAKGVGIPYGVHDPVRKEGFVVVGTSKNTSRFAVNAYRTWWKEQGGRRYPGKRKLLLLVDDGGANGSRRHAWKAELQRFANRSNLEITVAHYPTGGSKWNPVEHELFSPISINWAGEPLCDYKTMLGFIRRTETESGKRCKARLDTTNYNKPPRKNGPPLNIRHGKVLPKWNYTIKPSL